MNIEQTDILYGRIYVAGKVVGIGGEPYQDTYIVTPKLGEQTLPTENKLLSQDLKINAIPFNEVTNPSGGMTITIGEL